ncbi:MAG: hypothetical protein M4579_002281 [Chaenotheca gracillima]|nr:MAG: hypothetical protein M4579_002281 [Chaenotheca gracillima]
MPLLADAQLKLVASSVASVLDELEIDYAIMGGAATCLLTYDPARTTEDVDLVIQVDDRGITADRLTGLLLEKYPAQFGPVNQYGHVIPGFKMALPGDAVQLVEIEVFDLPSWPQRHQYNLANTTPTQIQVNG